MPTLQAPTCSSSLPPTRSWTQGASSPAHPVPLVPSLRPCSRPGPRSGLPELRWLQRVQRRFIKALHGVAVVAAGDGQQARLNSRSASASSRPALPEVPVSSGRRAEARRRGDASLRRAQARSGTGSHVTYPRGLRWARPAWSGLCSRSRPGE